MKYSVPAICNDLIVLIVYEMFRLSRTIFSTRIALSPNQNGSISNIRIILV